MDLESKRWKKPDKLNTGWNRFGNFVGIVWELFGNCLELSDTDYQLLNIIMWELFGNCLGIVWELFGNLEGILERRMGGVKKK